MSIIKEYRVKHKIQQQIFAINLEISQGNLSKLENKGAKPNFFTLQKIYKHYPRLFDKLINLGK